MLSNNSYLLLHHQWKPNISQFCHTVICSFFCPAFNVSYYILLAVITSMKSAPYAKILKRGCKQVSKILN